MSKHPGSSADDDHTVTGEFVEDGDDLFLVFNGVRIAKRGQPGSSQARTWIALIPGYSIIDYPDRSGLIVTADVCG